MPTPPRRAELRRLWREDSPQSRARLDALPTDGAHGAVLIERLRFGPPETWAGWRPGFGRVAVKLWPPGAGPAPLPPVAHPGIARLLDQGPVWRVFAWAEGETLARHLRQAPLTPEALAVIEAAVAALHHAGVAHADLTPANIVMTAAGPVLIDWGEDVAGTPGWRPDSAHDSFARDRFALCRLNACLRARKTP
jgi:hypothetical protein